MAIVNSNNKIKDNRPFLKLSKKSRWGIIILSFLLLFFGLFLPVLIGTYSIPTVKTSRTYRVGELSDETIYAPIDFSYIDDDATNELYTQAVSSILPAFTYSMSDSIKVRMRADDFASLMSAKATMTPDEFLQKYDLEDSENVMGRLEDMGSVNALFMIRLIYECTTKVISKGLVDVYDIYDVMQEGWDTVTLESADEAFVITREEVSLSDLLTRKTLPQFVLSWITSVYPNTKSSSIDIIIDGVELLAGENVKYDEILTQTWIEEAKSKVTPVLVEVKKGDELLSIDKIVTAKTLRTIDEINSKATIKVSFFEIVGRMFYIATLIVMFLIIFMRSIQYRYRVASYTIIVLVFVLIIIISGFFWVSFLLGIGFADIDAFLPFFILPLLVSAITNNKIMGLTVSVFFAAMQNTWPTSSIYTFFYIVTSCSVCIYFIKFNNDRIQVIVQSLESAAAVACATFVFALLEKQVWESILISVLGSFINVLLAHFVLSILLPIFERVFNIPTGYRLHELSYTDTPALNRLNQVALGTYNHAKNVSDMAYAAAKAIGANAELARVGALYHDIGKTEHPEYFVENQTGKNAHDDISSTLSAAIIKSHVKIGVEKAKEIGLPQEVIDIIAEHHGNDLIKFFYNEAMKNNKLGSTVSEEDFRYSGRIPSTPESAIVMLADCVEAATRTIKNPNHQKYEKFISSIITDKIAHKQLDNSTLTLTNLEKIKEAFIHQLMGRDHHRIEYDNDK